MDYIIRECEINFLSIAPILTTTTMENKDQLFIKMALNAWNSHIKKATAAFDQLDDEGLQKEIAPGRNRVIYVLGHLTAVHDGMLPILGLGNRQYPGLDSIFIREPDNAGTALPPAQSLREQWKSINGTLDKHFAELSPDAWFGPHTLVSKEDFEKEPWRNKLNVLINRTNHLAHHLGQLVLVLK